MNSDTFLIIGAGAIGSIVGVHLARAGHDIAFVETNPDHVAAIRTRGLRLIGDLEPTLHPPVFLPAEITGSFDRILLAVKSRHTIEAFTPIAPRLSTDGYVVSLQNGLEEYKIAEIVGAKRTIGACLTFGGFYVEPGVVKFSGTGGFEIGELDGSMTPRLETLKQALEALQPVTVTSNIFGYLWAKIALGAVYFGTALVDDDVPAIYGKPEARAVLEQLCGEVVKVADRLGIRIESADGFVPTDFRDGSDQAAKARSWDAQRAYWNSHDNKRTGVWRDLAIHKRKTEVEGQIEPVIRLAQQHNINVPHLERLVGRIKAVENGEKTLGYQNLVDIAA